MRKKKESEMQNLICHVTWYLLLNRLKLRGVAASCSGTVCIFKETAQTHQQDTTYLPLCEEMHINTPPLTLSSNKHH